MLLGCSGEPEGTWISRLEGTDAWLAVRAEGGAAAAYVCGGPTTMATHSRWMHTTEVDGSLSFAADGWSLTFERDDDGGSGELISPDAVSLAVNAKKVTDGGIDGLYTAFDSGCRDGLIIDGGGSQGTWCDDSGLFAEVTPLQPIALTDQGIAVSIPLLPTAREIFMFSAVPAQITE
jgi:hypothetical protein